MKKKNRKKGQKNRSKENKSFNRHILKLFLVDVSEWIFAITGLRFRNLAVIILSYWGIVMIFLIIVLRI